MAGTMQFDLVSPDVSALVEEARVKAGEAAPETRDAAELLVADLVALAQDMASDKSLGQGGGPAPG
jgi:ribosomal protein L11